MSVLYNAFEISYQLSPHHGENFLIDNQTYEWSSCHYKHTLCIHAYYDCLLHINSMRIANSILIEAAINRYFFQRTLIFFEYIMNSPLYPLRHLVISGLAVFSNTSGCSELWRTPSILNDQSNIWLLTTPCRSSLLTWTFTV